MRTLLHRSLLVAFCLLASAASARAECAWVLWHEVEIVVPMRTTRP